MKTIKILRCKINDNIIHFVEGITRYNEDYWDLLDLEVEDDFDVDTNDFADYKEIINNLN